MAELALADPTDVDPQTPAGPGPFYATAAEIAAAKAKLGNTSASRVATAPPADASPPLFASPDEITRAQATLNQPSMFSRALPALQHFGGQAAQLGQAVEEHKLAAGAAALSGAAGSTKMLADLVPRAPLPSMGHGGMMGAPRAPDATSFGADVADAAGAVATRADAEAEALKERARSEGNLGVVHGTLPTFLGGKPFDLTSMGAVTTPSRLLGAAVPYVAAGALAPEVEAPAALTSLLGPRAAQMATTAAVRSAAVAPVSIAQGVNPETSTLAGVAKLTGSPALESAAKSPVARMLTELGLEAFLNVAGEGVHGWLAAKKAGAEEVLDAAKTTAEAAGKASTAPESAAVPPTAQPKTQEAQRLQAAVQAQGVAPSDGKLQVTTFSDGTKIPTQYALVPRQEIAASHNAFTFQANPEATPGIQGRSYDVDPEAQRSIQRGGLAYDPDRALDPGASPAEGPPIVSSVRNAAGKLDVVAGNGRMMMHDVATAQRPDLIAAYRAKIVADAADVGLDPAKARAALEQDPSLVLVRKVVDPDGALQTPDQLATLNNVSDAPSAKVKSRGDDAATRARNLAQAPDALAHFGQTFAPDQTLTEYLGAPEGRQFLDKLVAEGVVSPTETRSFVNASGVIDAQGQLKLQDMLRASVLEDPRIIERGGAIVKKLDGSIPALALLKTAPPDWDLGPTVKQAVTLVQDARDAGMKDVSALANQGDLLGRAIDPAALELAQTMEKATPTALRDRFRAYATAAQEAGARSGGGATDLFPDMAAKPAELRAKLFGVTEGLGDQAVGAGGEMSGMPAAARSALESGEPKPMSATSARSAGAQSEPVQRSATVSLPSEDGTARRIAPLSETGVVRNRMEPSEAAGEGTPPSRTLADLHEQGKAAEPVLRETLQSVADAIPGAEVVGVRLKGGPRLEAKVAARGTEGITDMLGGRIAVDNYRDVGDIVDHLAQRHEILSVDDKAATPNLYGYRATHVQLRLPNGLEAEVQIVPKEIAAAQERVHLLYNLTRGDHGPVPPDVAEALVQQQRHEFDTAWEAHQLRTTGEHPVPATPPADLATAAAHPDLPPEGRAALERYTAERGAPLTASPEEVAAAQRSLLGNRSGGAHPEAVKALAGGGLGAAVGAKEDPEHPFRGAAIGFGLGAVGQKLLRSAIHGLTEGPKRWGPEAEPVPPPAGRGVLTKLDQIPAEPRGAALTARTERLPEPVAVGSKIRPEDRQPVAPSVTTKRPELGLDREGQPTQSPRDYFNVPRLNLPPELQDAVANRVTALAPGAQGVPKRVVSNSETASAAAHLLELKTPAELAAIDPTKMSGVQGVAIASLVKERTVAVGEILGKLKDPNLAAPARHALEEQLLQADGEANQLLRTIMKGASEQGRDLQANKILANLRSPEAALIKAQRFLGDRLLTPEEKTELLAHVNAGDETKTTQYLASLRKSSTPEQLVALRNAGLLTSLKNRITYISGSAINLFTEQAVNKPVATLADALTSYLLSTGQRTHFLGSNTGLYGTQIRRGLRDAMARFSDASGLDVLTRGGMPRDPLAFQARVRAWAEKMQQADLGGHGRDAAGGIPRMTNIDFAGTGKLGTALDVYSKASPRITAAIDGFVGPIAYRGAMVDAAESIARAEKTPPARFDARVRELVDAPTDEMIAAGKLERDRMTFQNDETMSRVVSKFRQLPNAFPVGGQRDAANAVMHFLFPYLRTGGNIAARVADYSGLAGVRAVIGLSRLSRALESGADAVTIRRIQRDVSQLAGRAATGALGTFGVGAALYKEGLLTGAYPTDAREREQWRLEGTQANSVKVFGHWMPVARFTPLGGAMAAGANLAHALEHGQTNSPEQRAFALAGATARSSLDNPLFTGTQSMMEAVQDPDRFGEKLLQSQASSLVPTGIADLAKATDQGISRRPQGAVEALEERIPGLRGRVQPAITGLGDTMHGREGWANTFLNPFSGPAATDRDPVVRMLHDTKGNITSPKREGAESDKDLAKRRLEEETPSAPRLPGESAPAFTARSRAEGQAIRQALTELIESGELHDISDPDERQRLVDDVITRTRRGVRDDEKDAGMLRRKGA